MPKDVRIIPAQGSIDFSLSQGFITSLIQLTDSGTLSIASTGPIQIGASNTVAIQIVSNNFVGINTAIPSQNLHVQGNLRLTGGLYDSTNSPGTANQLLISTGSGIAWTSVNVTGILTATGGIPNRVSKFLDEDTLGNSNITDSGTQIVLGSASSVSGILTSFGYFGPGTNITNLNASNLASGTVPSSVVSGSYSGITSVGTLTQLITTGFATASGFFGPGTFITNLNASNLASGTVPSAVVSGSYSGITSVGTLTQLITTGFATASGFFGPGTFVTNLNASNLASGTVPSAVVTGTYSGITSVGSLSQLIVTGFSTINNIRISGSLYDSTFSPGTANQILISTGSGIAWTTSTATGILTGSGTINTVPKFNTANSLTNSNITDNGIAVTINSRLNVVGIGSFTNDLIVNQITVGQGGGQSVTNTAIGLSVLSSNTLGVNNVGLGGFALNSNISGNQNLALGREALRYYSTSSNQIAIGFQALQGSSTVALNTGTQNMAIGYQAGAANTSGFQNTFIGYQAGFANTSGIYNTMVGHSVLLANTTGSFNNAFGVTALRDNTSGQFNNAFGYQALLVNITGDGNSVFGHTVMQANTTGSDNTAMGVAALISNISGGQNVAIGRQSLRYYNQSNQTAIGYQALQGNATVALNTGTQNTAVGYQAGLANSSGSNNTFLGYAAGAANTSGTNNTFLGRLAGTANQTSSSSVGVGAGALESLTNGNQNTAVGASALRSIAAGSADNFAGGFQAMFSATSGSFNVIIGKDALYFASSASNNVAIGWRSLYNVNSSNQVAVGYQALQGSATTELNTGTQNTVVGYLAGTANTAGSNNTFVGQQAGDGNTSGSFNSYYGALTDGAPTGSYQIALGNSVVTTGSNLGAWGGVTNTTRTDLGVGTFTPLGRIHIETLASGNMGLYIAGAASQTGDLVEVNATTNGQNYFTITGIGSVGIYTSIPSQALDVNGGTRLRGRLFDGNNAAGTAGQLLSSTGSGVAWTSVVAAGILTGSGTINTVPKFNTANSLTNSNITDSGTQIVLGSASSVSGILTSFGYFGPGTNITNLNASNLASGTVPSAVVSGSYSGITSVGTLNGLTVSPGNIVLSPSVRSQTTSSPARYLYKGINNTLGTRNESSVSLSPTFGRILNRNPDLLDQRLGYSTYDNNNSGQVNIGVTSDFSAPNSSGYVLTVNYLGIGTTAPSPGLGGYFIALPKVTGPRDLPNLYGYRRGERIWHRIWASISTGYNINFGSNSYGDGGQFTWISSTIGTNNWYLYEAIQNIGTSGTFNDTAYYYLNSSVGTSNPVTWYVASTHLIGEDESPTVQYTSNLNIGYTTGLNQNFGDFASTGTTLLALNSASVGIRTAIPTRAVDVNADIRLRAILYDGNNSAGTAGQLLSSTATGIVWTSITASGIITGIGSVNVIPKFGSVFSLTTSNISDSGTQIVFNSNTNTTGLATFRNISLTTSSLTTSAFMQFVGAYNDPITLNVGLATTGSISFNGSQGQLFTITNNLTTGSIFSVNDVSGIPSIDVNASGAVLIAPYGGNVGIGTTNAPDAFRVQTTSRFIGLATFGAVNITRNLYDVNTSPGTAGQLLSSLVTGVAWSSPSALGVVTGSAAANQITVWNSSTSVTGFSTFVFVNPGVGINTTAPIKSLHIRNNGILIDGSSTSDPAGYAPRLIIDSGASTAFVLADFKNNLGSVFYVTGSRVSIGNSSVVTNVFNVNGGDALINTLTVGLGSGQIATNTALGVSALAANTTGNSNVAVGYLAGLTNTSGTDNTFVGSTAGRINNAGSNNTAVGSGALPSNTSGSLNAAFGATALNSNSTGAQNSAFGYGALNATTTGSNNSAFGFNALQNNVTTSGNVGMGRDALRYYANSSNQTAIGFGALRGNSTVVLNTGTGNVAVGYQAGLANTSGSNNTFIGELAGTANTSGSNNLFVGYSAGSANLTGSNNIGLGYLSLQSNTSGTFNFASGGMAANTTGSDNSAAGHFALNSNTTGSGNAAFGRDAMRYWVSASNQTAIGYGALQGNSTVALNTGNSNIAVGFQAGVANTSGSLNSYLGHQAGQANASGTHNTLVGALTGLANTASHNTVLGANSFAANTSGSANVIVGSLAAQANVSGANNVAVGYNVIVSNTSGGNNTAVGYQAMEQNTTGGSNVAIGRFALRYYQTVSNQVAVGESALQGSSTVAFNTGTQNTAIGYQAGFANTSGVRNVFIGWSAGIANTSGSDNVAVGNQALWGNQTGIQNVAIGSFALNFNILGNYNIAIGQDTLSNFENTSTQVAIGYRALRGNNTRGLNTGFSNVAVGREALGVNTSGSNNTALGAQAGVANTTGNQNTFIGAQSGDGNITGNSNTYLGYLTDGLPAGSYQIAVGDSVTPTASNLGAWGGNTNATRTNLGVGTFTPLGRLHVETLAATNIGVYIAGSASQTGNLFEIDSTTNGPAYFVTTGIGSVGIYTSVPTQPLHVQGNVRITGGILDSNNQIGLAGSVLSSTGSGISWIASAGASSVTGSGSTNRVAKFSGPSSVTDSTITDTGSVVTIGVGLSVSGFSSSFGFYGPGTFITNLNASNLASGTVPSAVVSGSYSGITSVGTLSQLIVTGISTLQNLELDGWLRDSNNSIGSSGQLLSSTGSGVAWSSSATLGIVTGSGFANQVTFWATSNQVTGISTFVYNGNLGIGTTNPTNLLHVSGTSRIDTALIINSNNTDTFTQRGFAGASTSTASTSFITLATITIPAGYTLNIEAKINGWSSTSLNESGKVFGIFYNDSGTAVQVGTTDVVSKYIGVGGNFDIQTSGSNANIVVKSNSGISSWNWSTQYDYLLSRNVSSGATPPVPPVPPSPTPP